MNETEKLLREIRDLMTPKGDRFFVYCNTSETTAVEALLDESVRDNYLKSETVMTGLWEYLLLTNNADIWNNIKVDIIQQQIKAHATETRLPISGSVGTIEANVGDLNILDLSKGTQTNDVKITHDGEAVVIGAGSSLMGQVNVVRVEETYTATFTNIAAGLLAQDPTTFKDGSNNDVTEIDTTKAESVTYVIITSGSGTDTDINALISNDDSTYPVAASANMANGEDGFINLSKGFNYTKPQIDNNDGSNPVSAVVKIVVVRRV